MTRDAAGLEIRVDPLALGVGRAAGDERGLELLGEAAELVEELADHEHGLVGMVGDELARRLVLRGILGGEPVLVAGLRRPSSGRCSSSGRGTRISRQ